MERGRSGPGTSLGRLADDLRYATRSLTRNPGYALFAGLTLALGIGATTATFSAVESVLLRPFPYEAADRMYMLMRPYGPSALITPGREQVEAWRAEKDIFEVVEILGTEGKTLTGRGAAKGLRMGLVPPRILDVLDLHPRLGRGFLPEDSRGEGERVVILSDPLWRSDFGGDPDVLGHTVTLDGEAWTVIGVMPPRAPFPSGWSPHTDLWAPFPETADRLGSVLAVAREGLSPDEIQARLDLVQERVAEAGESAEPWAGAALPMVDQVGSSVAEPLRILMAAVMLLLLIACVNVANLLLSRATSRRHETVVRTAIGATRRRLMRQLLLESLLLGVAGAAAGLAVAYGSLEVVRALRPDDLAVLDEARINARVLAFAAGAGVLSAMLFGTLPAWQGTRQGSLDTLRSGARLDREGSAGRRFRWLLVGGEVALSFALLVGSVMAVQALVDMQRQDPVFRAEGLLAVRVSLPSWKYEDATLRDEAFQRLRGRITGLGGVADVALANGIPPNVGLWIGAPIAEGEPEPEERELVFGPMTDAEYHRVLGIPMVAGRSFTEEEIRDGARVTILGRTAARRIFGGAGEAVGRRVRMDSETEWSTVVGVAADIGMHGPGAASETEMQHYRPLSSRSSTADFAVRLSAGADAGVVLGRIRAALRAEEPEVLFGTTAPVVDLLRGTAARERFTSLLLSTFAALALLLAGIGLYGVVSQVVGQRRREIGIRVSLGAGRGDIRRLVLGGGARAMLVGVLAGSALAWLGLRALSSRIFGLEGAGAPDASYGAAALLVMLVTLAACWIPTRRATGVDPVEALRED